MLRFLRKLLGLCNHEYQMISRERVKSRPGATFISIDRAGKYDTHELFVFQCAHCCTVRTRRVDLVTGKVKCR
jgi:hypothetical protein